ncbi:isopentenyl pyrophosphate isomerase [Bacillus coahuilensis m2-6]|uniref:type 2 isopentenyl-diphosphate Delta-isomerase n=1 Tax=Bacillus coahuilensis TaxID=408580 RepID=UPI0001850F42|nr:type 2 isopentenyl-diphosphate Delta-isomerase [Bacillus coahuilensis]KUP07790.1 isopentenyl pyrophosphate isomerase [Bacillus coahuilensis m2-6]
MSRAQRKKDHIEHALNIGQSGLTGFSDISFVHQSLPNTSLDDINIHTKIGELFISSPIYINAMTGGGGEHTLQINRNLTEVAKHAGIPIAVGSQMAAIKDAEEKKTFEIVRKYNPNGIVFGNLGSEATVDQAKAAVDMIEADALQIHLNVLQELTMPEGDRSFVGALHRIENIVQSIDVPVIVKETGYGISKETAELLRGTGISAIDVGGFGGTNFSSIENARRNRSLPFFENWGIPTAASIVEAAQQSIPVLSSGGIRDSESILKSLVLGAKAVGLSGFFLKILMDDGQTALLEEISCMLDELKMMMCALGANQVQELQQVPIVISGSTYHWLKVRGLSPEQYSTRIPPRH